MGLGGDDRLVPKMETSDPAAMGCANAACAIASAAAT
jgi:hypothetical protein